MLPPDYLEHFTDDIAELYNRFADSVIDDMARRIGRIGMSETSAAQIEIMQQAGQLRSDILRRLAALTKMSEDELSRLFVEAGTESVAYDNQIYARAGLNPLPLKQSPAMLSALLAGLQKTKGNLRNLSMTTAVSAQADFINAMNLAYQQTITGAMSYTEAIKRAATGLAGNGVSVIHYPSGHRDKVDVAARRAVLTGVNQTVGQAQLIHAREMGCNHVETTAHFGARPDHQEWQGRVFTINGSSPQYPNLVDATGYGSGPGLMGWNCRHSFFPFFPGISAPAYSKGEYDDRFVSYNGVEMTQYDASQKQREMERSIRQTRRELSALNAAAEATTDEALKAELKSEFTRLSAKLKNNEAKYTAFSNAVGLRRQPDRLQTFGFNRSVSSRAVWANRAFTTANNRGIIASGGGRMNVLPNASKAVIPIEKFDNYALNVVKEPDKAAAFKAALGYDLSNSADLIRNIRENVGNFNAIEKPDNGYGKRFEVLMTLLGANGKTANVKTAWIIDNKNGETRLTSAYVTKKRLKEG